MPMTCIQSAYWWVCLAHKPAGRFWSKPVRLGFPVLISLFRINPNRPTGIVNCGRQRNGKKRSKRGLSRLFVLLSPDAQFGPALPNVSSPNAGILIALHLITTKAPASLPLPLARKKVPTTFWLWGRNVDGQMRNENG